MHAWKPLLLAFVVAVALAGCEARSITGPAAIDPARGATLTPADDCDPNHMPC